MLRCGGGGGGRRPRREGKWGVERGEGREPGEVKGEKVLRSEAEPGRGG